MEAIIVGAGGHGKVVLEILRAAGGVQVIGFIDANPSLVDTQVLDVPVLGHLNILPRLRQRKVHHAIVAIGDNAARQSYCQLLHQHGFELINAIHPSAVVSPSARIGKNVVVAAGAVVGTDSHLADGVIVNTAAVVDHECQVAEFAHLCPGSLLAGRVTIAAAAFIGMGAKVIQCLTVASGAVVGAGAVVIRDVPPAITVVGVPARQVQTHQQNAG